MNQISVAQEHIATSITQYAIAAIYPRLVPAEVQRGNMVVTGVAGELHQVGANLVQADAMESQGWAVRFLGTNLPHSSVLSILEEISADVLCISTTLVANLPSVVDLVETVRNKLQRVPKIVLGGAAYRLATRFAEDLGSAETAPDLRGALAMLCP